MLIRSGRPVAHATVMLDLVFRDGRDSATVRVFYFDEENNEIHKSERMYDLGTVLHVLWEDDEEFRKHGYVSHEYVASEKDGVACLGESRLWRHKWFYKLDEAARPVPVLN